MHKWLLKSAFDKTPVSIIYESKTGGFSKRTIIVKKLSTTHCLSFDLEKKIRTFLIERLLAIKPVQKNADRYRHNPATIIPMTSFIPLPSPNCTFLFLRFCSKNTW